MANEKTIYDFSVKTNGGKELHLSDFTGKPILIVNTASKCGFTPQYAGLEELHKTYGPKGLVVIGFPCDQFAHQEPGGDSEIASFCSVNYGVTFQLTSKTDVNGKSAHPIFVWLKKKAPGGLFSAIKWNFTKFLVLPDGTTVTRFSPTTVPKEIEPWIEKALAR
jgi:glutathione peroxidase